ncbi:MAG: hypothetical protein KatS3mg103_0365 [Phycisphaerales bacterium]|nr:MAG: hypothetical protein KatS3mg103_0365 [Phycisphaerales bacterium]
MVVLAATGVLDMLAAAMLAAVLMVLTRCCTITEARRSIDWSVLIVIGAALGLAEALRASGAASDIAQAILGVVGTHPWLVLLAIYATTSLATEVITNNAAVALVFPIAADAAARLDVSLMPFVIAIMIGGSASFATPLGYQTNLMVYGPGGYRFADFLRIGVPMRPAHRGHRRAAGPAGVPLPPMIGPGRRRPPATPRTAYPHLGMPDPAPKDR